MSTNVEKLNKSLVLPKQYTESGHNPKWSTKRFMKAVLAVQKADRDARIAEYAKVGELFVDAVTKSMEIIENQEKRE